MPPPKEDMLRVLMKAKKLDSLLVPGPPALFPDGSSDLLDDGAHQDGAANDGDYANVYTRVDKEGVYTWRISAVGKLEDGSAFTRVMTVSTWAGIRPDAAYSIIPHTHDLPAPRGMAAVRVSLSPRDRFNEHLGPFRGDELKLESDVGTFDGDVTQDLDGTYHQVLYYPLGKKPQVTIHFAHGTTFPPRPIFPVTESLLCRFFKWLAHLFCKDC